MRHYYRFIILSSLLIANNATAWQVFVEGIEWRATEMNNWSYVNSETLPNQTIAYNTVDFHYSPGIRVGITYTNTWDATFAYTHFYTSTSGSTSGLIRPAFVGSVTAQPSAAELYRTAQFTQNINYNIFDLNLGQQFKPAAAWMLHPTAGLMGGWIYQTIKASFQQPTISTNEKITNNFVGLGPKAGVDTSIDLFSYHDCHPKLIASFAASYLVGNWVIYDVTDITPTRRITVTGPSQSMGALALQGALGFAIDHKKWKVKLAYEIGDWFNQVQFFDNDTGTHNNDLILQGLTLGVTFDLDK